MFSADVRTMLEYYLHAIALICGIVQSHLEYGFAKAPWRLATVVSKAWRLAKTKAMDAIRAEAWRQIHAWEGLRPKSDDRKRGPRRAREEEDFKPKLKLLPPLRHLTAAQSDHLTFNRRERFGPTYASIRKRIALLQMLVDETPEQQAKRLRRLGRAFARRLVKERLRKPPVIQPRPTNDKPPPDPNSGPRIRLLWSG